MPLRAPCLLAVATPLLLSAFASHAASRYLLTDLGAGTSGEKIDGIGQISGRLGNQPAIYAGGTWRVLQGNRNFVVKGSNDQERAVGFRATSDPEAVEWSPGGTYRKMVHGAVQSVGTVIHRDGTTWGAALLSSGHSFPFSKKDGVLAALPYDPDYAWTVPEAVNRLGQIAGFAGSASFGSVCPAVPEIYAGGSWSPLGSLGGTCGIAEGINDSGVVVGVSDTAGDLFFHAFAWQGGVMTDLGTLPHDFYSEAKDINQQGQIVGSSAPSDRAVIVEGGVMTPLDTLVDNLPAHARLEVAVSINEAGQILVNGFDRHDRRHAYLLDPE
jgi:probable HAF family extracellular repeat protein